MSNLPGRSRNQRIAQFAVPEGEVVANFTDYSAAVDCVDQLIRHNFPAAMVAIVGSDLRSVERVRGRLSYGSVALRGIITGSWLGLIVTLFLPVSLGASTAAGIIIGAGLGMLLNVLRFSFTRNRHEFSSNTQVVAASYDIVVPHPLSQQAKNAMDEHQRECVDGQHKH